jgi:hypothetical protein
MLIAAFVGSALGLLREGLGGTERTRVARKKIAESNVAGVTPTHGCCEAA